MESIIENIFFQWDIVRETPEGYGAFRVIVRETPEGHGAFRVIVREI